MKFSGLTDREVEHSRQQYGSNAIPDSQPTTFWEAFKETFGDPMIRILLIIAGLMIVMWVLGYADIYEPAGPVVAGAVILPKDCDILYINDSKKLSAAKREELYDIIMEQAVATGLGTIGPDRIDEINILQATYEAMRQAIAQLSPQPDLLLKDAVTTPKVTIPQVPIIKGDAKSISIGAASIIAKVTRDRMMVYYDSIYPEYGFASNKGYGSAEHIAALKKYGPTPIHRRTFIKNFVS